MVCRVMRRSHNLRDDPVAAQPVNGGHQRQWHPFRQNDEMACAKLAGNAALELRDRLAKQMHGRTVRGERILFLYDDQGSQSHAHDPVSATHRYRRDVG